MRGEDQRSEGFFSYVRLESRIPADHPLRAIRELVDAALGELSRSFDRLYSRDGRPSIPPERLLRALLLQAFYTVRSERQLMEQLDYNLLFRWFVGLSADDAVWDATVFCKNRDRLLDGDIANKFFVAVLNLPQVRKLLSSEHFSVDGTLIEAWASMKSFVPKDGGDPPSRQGGGGGGGRNAERNFHGEKRRNDTHSSTTDPDARLFRKGAGKEAKLCHMGHLMTENRNGLIVDARLTEANGTAERTTALDMIADNAKPGSTVGGDKNYDTADFVAGCRERGCTPHVSQNNTNRRSAIDRAHDPASRLSHQHDQAQADRRAVRMDQDRRRPAQDPPLRARPGRMVLRPDRGRLQSRPHPENSRRNGMSLSGVPKMRQKHPKYPANSGGVPPFGSPLTLENIERIDLALNFFSNLLEQCEQRPPFFDEISGELRGAATADVLHGVARSVRNEQHLAGLECHWRPVVERILQRAFDHIDDLFARMRVPRRHHARRDLDERLDELASGDAEIVPLKIGALDSDRLSLRHLWGETVRGDQGGSTRGRRGGQYVAAGGQRRFPEHERSP